MDYLCIAKVVKPQGLKGELKCEPYVDRLDRMLGLSHVVLLLDGEYQKKNVAKARLYKEHAFLTLEGVTDRAMAEALRGVLLHVDRENAAPLPEGSHYIADLIGLSVFDQDEVLLGMLDEVIQTGGKDVYSVKGNKSFLFPAVDHVILNVDLQQKKMVLDAMRLDEVAVYD